MRWRSDLAVCLQHSGSQGLEALADLRADVRKNKHVTLVGWVAFSATRPCNMLGG